jgi:hypothetical protein
MWKITKIHYNGSNVICLILEEPNSLTKQECVVSSTAIPCGQSKQHSVGFPSSLPHFPDPAITTASYFPFPDINNKQKKKRKKERKEKK